MILKFPNLDTLRLALTSGAVPPALAQTAAVAAFDDQHQVWVETEASVPLAAQTDLRRLGVQVCKTSGATTSISVTCWPQILPLRADPDPIDRLEQTPILFEVPGQDDLGRLVVEILRLGNDRQGFRWLDGKTDAGEGRGLLRVVGPPYYSLLRAINRNGLAAAPRAYRERAPRVWIEVGWMHPLADHLKPPLGKLLLASGPRQWTLIDDGPFRDVYEVMEFALPNAPSDWNEGALKAKIRPALRLTSGGSTDGAELWVLRDGAVEELNRFVQNSDDQMLHRLAFAVGEKDGRTVIVMRVRPSRLPPPELVLEAEAYKPYLKLPNLFLPAGQWLHPPLRRDMVRKLLADDSAQVVWLTPLGAGAFRPETLPEDAFRPLIDWIDYILDQDKEPLEAWIQAAQFDFEAFICDEDLAARPKSPPEPPRDDKRKDDAGDVAAPADPTGADGDQSRRGNDDDGSAEELFAIEKAEPSELQQQLRELEERFAALEGDLDAPERVTLWPQLANVNAALGDDAEAGVCWLNALWGRDTAPEAWTWNWFRAEAAASLLTAGDSGDYEIAGEEWDHLLALEEPSPADLRALAAYLVWAVRRGSPPKAILKRLNAVQQFVEAHEALLPTRALWLTWLHLVQLSGGDVLALARARDRLLERLYQTGLRPEQDLPAFLRFSGQAMSQRFRGVGVWLGRMAEKVHDWIGRQETDLSAQGSTPKTREYSDLLVAFGLARLGERDAALELVRRAKAALAEEDDAHTLLFNGFEYRIQQALDGKTHGGPLPADQMEYLEHLRKSRQPGEVPGLGYVVDAMRQASRVLEPDKLIEARIYTFGNAEELQKAELARIADRTELANRVRGLLRLAPKGAAGWRAKSPLLRTALDESPRVGEEFAQELLRETAATFDALIGAADPYDLTNLIPLMERALFIAAHFDLVEHLQGFIARFPILLQALYNGPGLREFDAVAGRCFRGLRKLGLREEVDLLLGQTANLLTGGKELTEVVEELSDVALSSLLHVAGGWLAFGRERQAQPVLQAARSLLLGGALLPAQQTALACAYAAALGQAHVETAKKRIEEMFERIGNVRDGRVTHKWFSQWQLKVIEAVVLAVVSDDFTLGTDARRWLDEDEYLVRRRVHKDYRAVMANG